METVKVDKVSKRKRKKDMNGEISAEGGGRGSLYKSDRDIEHKHKRIHTSNGDTEIPMSVEQQEEMLDTVSGHIRELVMKEREASDPTSKHKETKSKISVKEKTKLSKRAERKIKEPSDKEEIRNNVTCSESSGESRLMQTAGVTKNAALEYLWLWKEEREKWTFKKKTQYWLLQHMYDRTMVPKSEFKILLLYLEGLHGHQRELSKQKAQKIVDQFGEEGLSASKRHYKRAVAIMRVLG